MLQVSRDFSFRGSLSRKSFEVHALNEVHVDVQTDLNVRRKWSDTRFSLFFIFTEVKIIK